MCIRDSIKGVANGYLICGVEREIQINLDKGRMQEFGITPMIVQGAIRAANLDFPTGYLQSDQTQRAVRLSGKITSIEELRRLILRNVSGTPIRLEDVAEVVDGVKDPVKMGRVNGQEAILLNILKQSDANALQVSEAVGKQIQNLEEQYASEGLKVEVAQDTTTFTRNAISSVLKMCIRDRLRSTSYSLTLRVDSAMERPSKSASTMLRDN